MLIGGRLGDLVGDPLVWVGDELNWWLDDDQEKARFLWTAVMPADAQQLIVCDGITQTAGPNPRDFVVTTPGVMPSVALVPLVAALAAETPAYDPLAGEPLANLTTTLPWYAAASGVTALRFRNADGDEVRSLNTSGTIPGVWILAAAGYNGTGVGTLRYNRDGTLQYKSPGASSFGTAVSALTIGPKLLTGASNKWLAVVCFPDYLPTGPLDADVVLSDLFHSDFASDDVTAAEASAGDVKTFTLDLANAADVGVTTIRVWLDATVVSEWEISLDGVSWVKPTSATHTDVLKPADIAAGASVTIHFRRTIAGSTPAHTGLFNLVHWRWASGGTRIAAGRGKYRIANDEAYNFYRKEDADPQAGIDTPFDTNATLPHTPADTYADGDWRLSVARYNGYIEGGFKSVQRMMIAGGVAGVPPSDPRDAKIKAIADGAAHVSALYLPILDGANAAEQFALWYTTDGSDPSTAGAPDYTTAFNSNGSAVMYNQSLPTQPDGTTIKAVVKVRRNDGTESVPVWVYSTAEEILSVTADAEGPGHPFK